MHLVQGDCADPPDSIETTFDEGPIQGDFAQERSPRLWRRITPLISTSAIADYE